MADTSPAREELRIGTVLRMRHSAVWIALILFGATVALSGCAGARGSVQTKTDFVLDTACTITIFDKAPDSVLSDAFHLLRQINRRMTIDGEASELMAVSRAAGEHPVRVTDDLYGVVKEGVRFSKLTGGAFDITVGPLVELWAIGRGGRVVPPETAVTHAVSLIDYRNVVLDDANHTVFLGRKGMVVDLGGIAKGYAGGAVASRLRREGVRRAIIDLGGNIVAMGERADGTPWRIGIQDPNRSRGSYVGVVSVVDKAVVTSGKYERYFVSDDKRYHHILSTKSGFPVENGIASVSIVSSDSTTADALSTSLFLLGVRRGIELVDSLDHTDAIILTENKRVYVSGGLHEQFRLTDHEYTMTPRPISRRTEGGRPRSSAELFGRRPAPR